MIQASLASLAGAWIARGAERGNIPDGLSVPLTLLVSRLPAPVLVAGAIGYGLYRLNIETRAKRAKDVTPKRSPNSGRSNPKTRVRAKRRAVQSA